LGQFFTDFGEIGKEGWDFDFVGLEEFGGLFGVFHGFVGIVEGTVWVVGIDHKVEGLIFLLGAVEELDGVVVVFLWAAAIAEFSIVAGEVPGEGGVSGGMGHFSEDAGEVAVVLEVREDGGDLFWEGIEAVAAGVVTVAAGGDDAAAGGADGDVDVGAEEGVIIGGEFREIRGDLGDAAAVEIELFVAEVIGSEKEDVKGGGFANRREGRREIRVRNFMTCYFFECEEESSRMSLASAAGRLAVKVRVLESSLKNVW
jgi:hypothetical protein